MAPLWLRYDVQILWVSVSEIEIRIIETVLQKCISFVVAKLLLLVYPVAELISELTGCRHLPTHCRGLEHVLEQI